MWNVLMKVHYSGVKLGMGHPKHLE